MIHPYAGKNPSIHPSAFLAASAEIIGDVAIGEDSSVWFNAVIRGDVDHVRIGRGTNVQDGCLLHVRSGNPLIIGSGCTLGHGVIAHACTIGDNCLLGMGSIILDNSTINSFALVAAGALVPPNEVIPEGVLVAGLPARVVRPLTREEKRSIESSARHYCQYAQSYRGVTPCG